MTSQFTLHPDPSGIWALRIVLPAQPNRPEQVFLRPTSTQRDEAEQIAADVATLLTTKHWSLESVTQANLHPQALAIVGDPSIIAYFAYHLPEQAAWALREQHLPLPLRHTDYHRILLIGQTGAGKTSVLRQFLGVHWGDFPATGRDRTTTGFFEAIFTQSATWNAVITFHPRHVIASWLDQCLQLAIQRVLDGEPAPDILAPFEEDPSQRVRFTNTISVTQPFTLQTDQPEQPLLFWLQQVADDLQQHHALKMLSPDEPADLRYPIAEWLQNTSLLYPLLREALVQQVFNGLLSIGSVAMMDRDLWGWPRSVIISSPDEATLLQTLHPFSRNSLDGTQHVTSLVSGIRIAGPFLPKWRQDRYSPHLVIIDGEGLGHAGEIDGGLPPEYTQLLPLVDHLVWVVSSDQPMGSGTKALLTDIAQRAWIDHLFLAYTKCEPHVNDHETEESMRTRLVKDTGSVIERLAGTLSPLQERHLRQRLKSSIFFLRSVDSIQMDTLRDEQLEALMQAIQRAPHLHVPPAPLDLPTPSDAELALIVQHVGQQFWKQEWPSYAAIGSGWKLLQSFGLTLAKTGLGYSYRYLNPIRALTHAFGGEVLRWWNAQVPLDETETDLILIRQQHVAQLMQQFEALLRPRLREEFAAEWEIFRYTYGRGSTLTTYLDTLREIFRLWFPYRADMPGWEDWMGQMHGILHLKSQEPAA